jgi:transposase-like protein
MPRKPKDRHEELISELVKGMKTTDELFGKEGLFTKLKKAALESLLEAEMSEHLGYEKHAPEGFNGENSRNGHGTKSVVVADETVGIDVPRDRDGTFEPQLVKKGQRRIAGFDDQVVALYARGLSVREIQEHVKEMYDVDVSPDLISRVTDRVLADIEAWQRRTLGRVYAIVYFDGFVVRVRDEGIVRNKTVYIVLGVDTEGHKDVLGMWMAQTEGAKFWMQVATDLRYRGVEDILIACCDGLKGLPEAIEAVFAHATVQTCIVHVVRHTTRFVNWKDQKALTRDLRTVYTAANESDALAALDAFDVTWGKSYPSITSSWRANWTRISPFFALPAELRRAVYTTNPIEALNRQLRKITKTRGAFPTDASVMKLLWLAVDRAAKKWQMPIHNWGMVRQQLAIVFGDRFPTD